jgi:tRNA pseudouridine55 synthase
LSSAQGFLCIDKQCGISSFAAVSQVRRLIGCSKAGHSGTLDPQASGLLLIALGSATRLLPLMPLEPKKYRFKIQFGSQTDTLDAQGRVIISGNAMPRREACDEALPRFRGSIMQIPPQFSAVKIKGRRAYRMARQGRSVTLPARKVVIYDLAVIRYDEPSGQALLEVTCSGGTYVRGLARDIAAALGTCGYALSVRRLSIGTFTVENACTLEGGDRLNEKIISVYDACSDLNRIIVDEPRIVRLRNGCAVVGEEPPGGEVHSRPVIAFDDRHTPVAVLKRTKDGSFRPVKVLMEV